MRRESGRLGAQSQAAASILPLAAGRAAFSKPRGRHPGPRAAPRAPPGLLSRLPAAAPGPGHKYPAIIKQTLTWRRLPGTRGQCRGNAGPAPAPRPSPRHAAAPAPAASLPPAPSPAAAGRGRGLRGHPHRGLCREIQGAETREGGGRATRPWGQARRRAGRGSVGGLDAAVVPAQKSKISLRWKLPIGLSEVNSWAL